MTQSYQHPSEIEPILVERNHGPTSRRSISKVRHIMGMTFLTAGAVFLLMTLFSSVPRGTSYLMKMIPIELEGSPFHRVDEESNHEVLQHGCEATVILMRHCEKGLLKKHCDYIGLERAVYLASLFGDGNERWPTPSYIFAEGPGGRHSWTKRNYREIETVGPLSEKTGVLVDASYNSMSRRELIDNVADLIKSGEACGKVVLIVWKHSELGHLAHKLGCGTTEGCPLDYHGKTFDLIWQLRFVYNFVDPDNSHYRHHRRPPTWQVFGSVQPEDFDPLAFSKKMGDYPIYGRLGRSQWLQEATVLRDETVTTAGDNWEEVKPSFVI